MWEVTEEEAINNFCLNIEDPAIVERVFNLGTPQVPLVTLVGPISPEPIPIPPYDPPTIILQTVSQSPSPLPIYIQDIMPPPPPTPSSGYEDLLGAPQVGERPDDNWYHNHDREGVMFMILIPDGDNG